MRIHFIGIGGEGMCGVAKLALANGHSVSGSELADKKGLAELKGMGASIYREHRYENVIDKDMVVRSSGIPVNHLEVEAAHECNIGVLKRSTALGMLLNERGQKIIGVAGTHGKSTTTSMLGSILEEAGLDPTVIVGTYVPRFGSHARIGNGEYAIVEACEFDRSFLDLGGYSAVVTSIRLDHLDYYKDGLEEIVEAFRQFVNLTDISGICVACADERVVTSSLLPMCQRNFRTYGLNDGEWQARDIPSTSENSFLVSVAGVLYGEFSLGIPGKHNIQNAVAAIGMADFLQIPIAATREALRSYSGIRRRYEKRIDTGVVTIIDDYGHLPHEIAAVISTIRYEYPDSWLMCVCSLRQFHRTLSRLREFAAEIARTDVCVVAPIIAGLGDEKETLHFIKADDVAQKVREFGCDATGCRNNPDVIEEVVRILSSTRKEHVVILCIGSGTTEVVDSLCEIYAT